MTTFVSDTFTDTAGVSLLPHTGETGAAWAAHPISGSGDALISDANRLRGNVDGYFYASGVPGSADYYVEASIYVAANTSGSVPGVLGRVDTAANTFYCARYVVVDGQWGMFKIVAGSVTGLGSAYTQALTPGNSYALRLDMVGTTIRLLVDGVERINVTDSSISAAGRAGITLAGLSSNSTHLHIDSVTAVDVTSGGSGPTIDTDPSNATVTEPAAASFTVVASGNGSPMLYQWQENDLGSPSWVNLSNGGIYSGALGPTLTINPTSLSMDGYLYRCVVTDDDGSATSAAATLNVDSAPTLTSSPLKNNTGTLLTSQPFEAYVNHVSTGALILKKTGLTSHGTTGVVSFSDVALTAAVEVAVRWRQTSTGAEGYERLTPS